jgi:hypothetical protein
MILPKKKLSIREQKQLQWVAPILSRVEPDRLKRIETNNIAHKESSHENASPNNGKVGCGGRGRFRRPWRSVFC